MKDAERCHSDRLKGFPIFQVFHTASRKISEACTYVPSTTVVAADCMQGVGQVFNLKRCKEFRTTSRHLNFGVLHRSLQSVPTPQRRSAGQANRFNLRCAFSMVSSLQQAKSFSLRVADNSTAS